MPELQNSFISLSLDPQTGTFSILPADAAQPKLLNARLGVRYRQRGQRFTALSGEWANCRASARTVEPGVHGELEKLTLLIPGEEVDFEVTFGLLRSSPLLLWKVRLFNHSGTPLTVERIDMLQVIPGQGGSQVEFGQASRPAQMGFFYNGWQSWSPAGWVAGDGKMPHTHLGALQEPMIYNSGTPKPGRRGHFSSDFFAVVGDRLARTGFVLGFLSQKQQFGSIQADFERTLRLQLWANCDTVQVNDQSALETDWAVYSPVRLDQSDPLDHYLQAVARENQVQVPAESPVGWCSWYYFYTHITEPIIEANLNSIVAGQERLPVQLVQIDDGFESQVGDWFTFTPDFPNGVKPLAEKIKAEGLIPGLWLAPFIVHTKSKLMHEHPDWILRDAKGKPANSGYVWGVLGTALDLTVPEALDYACAVIRTAAKEWGYPYLKLDFLYAAALPGRYHDPTKTRAQVLRQGMEALRGAMGPEVTLLGCGAPLGSCLGLVEAMRIGPDVSGDWTPTFNGIQILIKNEPSFPCARNSIRDILTRANLHGNWWVNDPDCLLIRPDSHLTFEEVKTLCTAIGMTGGSMLLSDDLPKLSAQRMRLAEALLPVIGARAQVLDWFDAEMPAKLRLDLANQTGEWHLLARFNWQESPADLTISPAEFGLPAGEYWVHDFWQESTTRLPAGQSYIAKAIPAHGCVLCAFRPVRSGPQYLGGTLHYSLGKEVSEWSATATELNFTLNLPRTAEGKVSVAIPWQEVIVTCDENLVEFTRTDAGVIEFPVRMSDQARIKICQAKA